MKSNWVISLTTDPRPSAIGLGLFGQFGLTQTIKATMIRQGAD